jgi:hypothetical protein
LKGLARLAAVSAAAACAVYTIVYLYRWEWHRAIVAGIFLLVAEVALATAALMRRLGALERRLTDQVAAGRSRAAEPSPAVLERVREAAPAPRPPFAWLGPDLLGDRLGVFLPILLGAGVLASAAAWAVESLARATAGPVLERRLTSRLVTFDLPAGGLLGTTPAGPTTTMRRPAVRWWWWWVLGVLAVAGVAGGIDELSDATQSRQDAPRPGMRTVVELELHGELAGAVPTRVATSLWHGCVGSLQQHLPEPVITHLGGARMQLIVPVDIGVHIVRKLHGCLEDAGLDRVQAAVVTFRTGPRSE